MATVKFYNTNPVVTSWTDYYPFGYPMPNRNWNSSDYRFGFNGQEKDNEIYGEWKSYTAEFWQYDSRLGRRWNLDPKVEASVSPYACFGDNPILMYDENGDSLRNPQTSELKFAQESFNHINEQIQNYSGDRTSDDYKNLTEGLNDAKILYQIYKVNTTLHN